MQLPEGVTIPATSRCNICGTDVAVVDAILQPHRCRIDLDAQRGAA